MKKKVTKKLTLNRETLRALESAEAREAKGGNAAISWFGCPTVKVSVMESCVACSSIPECLA